MVKQMHASENAYALIRKAEGLAQKVYNESGEWTGWLKPYTCPAGLLTIGYGQTGKMPDGRPVEPSLRITEDEANEALQFFVLNRVEPLTRKHFNARDQNEFDALISWVYNMRHEKLEAGKYSLPRLINERAPEDEVIAKWCEYVNPRTSAEPGLYRRRLAELCLREGSPWQFAWTATLKRSGGRIIERTDPYHVLNVARAAAEKARQAIEAIKVPDFVPSADDVREAVSKIKVPDVFSELAIPRPGARQPDPVPVNPAPEPEAPEIVQPARMEEIPMSTLPEPKSALKSKTMWGVGIAAVAVNILPQIAVLFGQVGEQVGGQIGLTLTNFALILAAFGRMKASGEIK